MRQAVEKPTILLLSSAISYQRVENKLSSLDPILMQACILIATDLCMNIYKYIYMYILL